MGDPVKPLPLDIRQRCLHLLGLTSLDKDDVPEAWNKDDLFFVTMLFHSVAHSVGHNSGHLSQFSREQRVEISIEFGKNIRQSVELFSGVDLSDIILESQKLTDFDEG